MLYPVLIQNPTLREYLVACRDLFYSIVYDDQPVDDSTQYIPESPRKLFDDIMKIAPNRFSMTDATKMDNFYDDKDEEEEDLILSLLQGESEDSDSDQSSPTSPHAVHKKSSPCHKSDTVCNEMFNAKEDDEKTDEEEDIGDANVSQSDSINDEERDPFNFRFGL